MLVKAILDILRSKKGPSTQVVRVEMDNAGWVQVDELCHIINEELPGIKMNPRRLIDIVYNDVHQSMQLWVESSGRRSDAEVTADDFTKIRAVSGHSENTSVDYKLIRQERQKFQVTSQPQHYSGPDNVFYYTTMGEMMKIWRDDGISPDHAACAPKSKRLIYCTPVSVYNEGCPESCVHNVCQLNANIYEFQMTIDFRMVMKDGIDCFYTHDGYVAIDCAMLGVAYIKQVISIKTGQYWYFRQFNVNERFFRGGSHNID
jgi:hypothetical protein